MKSMKPNTIDRYSLLTSSEAATIVNGLQIAIGRFEEDVKIARMSGHPRLAEQFERQIADSRVIVDRLGG